jgi:two-component system, chemotaxis family, response regulator PixG
MSNNYRFVCDFGNNMYGVSPIFLMTTTSKLNSPALLSQLAETSKSGCLKLTSETVVWRIYLHQGSLQYVYCSTQSLDQLKYYLHTLGLEEAIAALKDSPPSFGTGTDIYSQIIPWLLTEQHINSAEGLKLLETITQDELQFCLWLDQGDSDWQEGDLVPSWIKDSVQASISLSISDCLNAEEIKRRQWQKCSQELLSVYQRPYFALGWEAKNLPPSGSLNHKTLMELTKVLRGRTSIRQLSVFLNKNEYQIAQVLSPYIDEKIICLRNPPELLSKLPTIPRSLNNSSSEAVKTWKIVCIDDSPTILQEIKRFLDSDKFQVTAIDDPVKAVSQIFIINPDLILLDITMPRINGYKLCGLLRNSGKCDQVPIIMVSGNTGLIDKTRAKLAGATDYFTKPFTREGLNQVIDKYLQ